MMLIDCITVRWNTKIVKICCDHRKTLKIATLAWLHEFCKYCDDHKQVAQLWQSPHELDTFSINVQRYSQSHAQNWIFGPAYGGIRGNICDLWSEIFNTNKPCSSEKQRISISESPLFGGLRGNVCDSSLARSKLIVDFL